MEYSDGNNVKGTTRMSRSPVLSYRSTLWKAISRRSRRFRRRWFLNTLRSVIAGGLFMAGSAGILSRSLMAADTVFDVASGQIVTQSGGLSGNGALIKTGGGTLVVTGTNSYTGGTTINGGTIRVENNSALGSETVTAQSGTLDFENGIAFTNRIALENMLTVNQDDVGSEAILSGRIFDSVGFWGLTKTGLGTIVLSGRFNTFGGATTVSAGSLKGTSESLRGNITNNATVEFDQSSSFDQSSTHAYTGNMSGTGLLVKSGPGLLTLSGSNAYTGGTMVRAGLLKGTTESLQGDITNDATVEFDQSSTGAYTGNMSGIGLLVKSGPGLLTLSGNNTYTGGTTVTGGMLGVTTRSLQGDVVNNAAITFDQSTDGTYAGNMSGTGSLEKTGTGTVSLSGTNNYTGGTTIFGGSLKGTTASLQGNITNNTTLEFDQSTDGTYSGNITGPGSIVKNGSGTVSLSGANTFDGPTAVKDGRLQVNGSISGNVAVDQGASLGGNGRVGRTTIQGTLAAGNSIGQLRISNGLTHHAGSTLEVELNSGGTTPGVHNDHVLVTTGIATMHGGTVNVIAAPGTYNPGTTYTILSAPSLAGAGFSEVTDNLATRDFRLNHSGNSVQLVVFAHSTFANVAHTLNEQAIGAALDSYISSANPTWLAAIDSLGLLSGEQQSQGINQFGSAVLGTQAAISVQQTGLTMQGLSNQLSQLGIGNGAALGDVALTDDGGLIVRGQSSGGPELWTGWIGGFGLGGTVQSDGNSGGAGYSMGGTSFGAAKRLDDMHQAGIYGSSSQSVVTARGLVQRSELSHVLLGGFLRSHDGCNYYVIAAAGGIDDYETTRTVTVGVPVTMTADFGGNQAVVYAERGLEISCGDSRLQPFAALQYVFVEQNAHTESGALALAVDNVMLHSVRSYVGTRASTDRWFDNAWRVQPQFQALWLHEFLDTEAAITSAIAAGGPSFTVQGTSLGRDWAILGLGLSARPTDQLRLFANYDLQMNEQQVFHLASGAVELTW